MLYVANVGFELVTKNICQNRNRGMVQSLTLFGPHETTRTVFLQSNEWVPSLLSERSGRLCRDDAVGAVGVVDLRRCQNLATGSSLFRWERHVGLPPLHFHDDIVDSLTILLDGQCFVILVALKHAIEYWDVVPPGERRRKLDLDRTGLARPPHGAAWCPNRRLHLTGRVNFDPLCIPTSRRHHTHFLALQGVLSSPSSPWQSLPYQSKIGLQCSEW
jgi:hypothetical protein